MGQVSTPIIPSIILSDVDRLTMANNASGLSPTAQHIIALGADALKNDSASYQIALGWQAMGGAGLGLQNDAFLEGSIAVGPRALASVRNSGSGGFSQDAPNIALGEDVARQALYLAGNIFIGSKILQSYVNANTADQNALNVLIGHNILDTSLGNGGTPALRSVVVGHQALAQGPTIRGTDQSVVIGYRAAYQTTNAGSNGMDRCVIIGAGAYLGSDTALAPDVVVIGRDAGTALQGAQVDRSVVVGSTANTRSNDAVAVGFAALASKNSVAIGANANAGSINLGTGENIAIGSAATISTGQQNIVVGSSAAYTGNRSIAIGVGATEGELVNNDRFVIGTYITGVKRGVLYGDMNAGNLLVGNSVAGATRGFGGAATTNALGILNGTKGATNPAGGGYFYVAAGALHWVGSAGTDTVVAPA